MRIFRSLYGRIAISFVVLLTAIAVIQLYFSAKIFRPLVAEVDQQIHWDLAAELVERIQPLVREKIEPDVLRLKLFELAFMNPKVEFYLLDESGKILFDAAFRAPPLKKSSIEIDVLERALQDDAPLLPIYGDDPRQREIVERVFSVASITIAGKPGYLYLMLESAPYRHMMRATGQFYIVTSVVVGVAVLSIFTIAIGAVIFFYLTRHFRSLTQVVGEYQQGNFDDRVDVSSSDEIGTLAIAVNQMADTIVTQTNELKENDRLRRELVANISHDLRSPITSVQGLLETVMRKGDSISSEERKEYLDMAHDSVVMQNQLVDDLFELSKLQARERGPELEPCALAELVQDAVLTLQPQANTANIKLVFEAGENTPLVSIDISMINRVLTNLISNALRYTREGGNVTVRVEKTDSAARVSVEDTGVGIPEEDLLLIFDSFYRVDKDRSLKTGGTGLGLAIVKRILELHNTEIKVESVYGEGTTFSFELEYVRN